MEVDHKRFIERQKFTIPPVQAEEKGRRGQLKNLMNGPRNSRADQVLRRFDA